MVYPACPGRIAGVRCAGEMVDIEKRNAGIVVAMAFRKHSGFDEENGHFPPQKVDKTNCHGYSFNFYKRLRMSTTMNENMVFYLNNNKSFYILL